MTTTEVPTGASDEHVLEEGQRLSESMLWDLQRAFFERQGVQAWCGGGVPSYITTNPYIARAYARVVAAFLRDCRPVETGQPVYIVELGAGSGRFAFHFLKALETIARRSAVDLPFIYVMTDFTDQNLSFWRAHPSLQPFLDRGTLDFARFDAACPAPLVLERSGVVLSGGTVRNPMVVLANYVFDSIPQDLYTVAGGEIHETLVTITSSQPEPDLSDPELLARLDVRLQAEPTACDRLDERPMARLLEGYRELPSGTTVLVPVAGLACVRHFRELSGDRMLLLLADWGHEGEEGIVEQQLGMLLHGSFSLPINYHALGRFVVDQGGTVLKTSGHHTSLKVSGFLFGSHRYDCGGTAEAFAQSLDETSPDDFFRVTEMIDRMPHDVELPHILALLRISGWDAKLFVRCYPVLRQLLEAVPETQYADIYSALQQVWDRYYQVPDNLDLAFGIATLVYGIGYYREALELLRYSLPPHSQDVAYFRGMCHWHLRELDAALQSFDQALALDPTHDAAREMRIKVQGGLDRRLT